MNQWFLPSDFRAGAHRPVRYTPEGPAKGKDTFTVVAEMVYYVFEK